MRRVLAVGVLVALVGFWLATRESPAPTPNGPGGFSFAVLGDAPYYFWEDIKYRRVLRELDAHPLEWVLHVGDIFWRPCSDARYRRTLDEFNRLTHAVIYTPGDNEWTDCWEPQTGEFAPLERLARIRRTFFTNPSQSLGRRALALESQEKSPAHREFVENARWSHAGVIVATVHLVGSANGRKRFPARTLEHDAEVGRRTQAAAAWVRETFALAREQDARAVVLGFHASPGFDLPVGHFWRESYEPFLTALEEEAESYARPVLIAHGDDHHYIVDRPLVRRTTGKRIDNLIRLEVPGSPDVGWVRVRVTPAAASPFDFEPHVVPWWKYW